MTSIIISSSCPAHWAAACARENLLFHSPDWVELLASSFGATTQYAWDEASGRGAAVTSFSAGPFKLGFLGFPCGGLVGGAGPEDAFLQRLLTHRAELLPVALRIPASAFAAPLHLDYACETTPETAIVDLPSWRMESLSGNHRRDIKKAMRSDIAVVAAERPEDGAELFAIYRDTVRRHRGGLRYNADYFSGLIVLAKTNPLLRVMLARLDGRIVGFTAVALHGQTANYLHGGMRLESRQHQPSALLLYEAIEWARGVGCTSFNLMSSPPNQPSLVWYKEKWGGVTRQHRTYTVPLRRSYRLFRIAERIRRYLG